MQQSTKIIACKNLLMSHRGLKEKNSAKTLYFRLLNYKKPKSKFWNCFILIFSFKKCWIKFYIILDFSPMSDLQTSITQPYNNHKVSAETVQGLCYYFFCCGELCCPSLWSNLNLCPSFEICFDFFCFLKWTEDPTLFRILP